MSTPDDCVFDIVPPRRPGIDDVGGGLKENDPRPGYLPNPVTMPTAEDDNQHQNLLVRYGSIVPLAIISVRYTATVPAVTKLATVIGGFVVGSITVTDTGTGDCSLTWGAGTLPTPVADHVASATGATPGSATAETISNGVRVRVVNAAGAAADINFVAFIY